MNPERQKHITLFVENFWPLVKAASDGLRYPALEMILSRGKRRTHNNQSPDHFRFCLFGVEARGPIPVAALTQAGDHPHHVAKDHYWLRADPVTMWADMAKVVMTNYGFADLDELERNEIENTVRKVLDDEGIHLHANHPERWCIALGKPLGFHFTPIEEALGMDIADAMPDHEEALHWHRILNEIQMALHACPVNTKRRRDGRLEINSVWFWGGGFIPDANRHEVFSTVYSDHPVSRGLATLSDCRLRPQRTARAADFTWDGPGILVDWIVDSGSARLDLNRLEHIAQLIVPLVQRGEAVVCFCTGNGDCVRYDRRSRRKFWRRSRILVHSAPSAATR